MPDINWSNESIKHTYAFKCLYDTCNFMENLTNFSLEQMDKIATRGDNISNLFSKTQARKIHTTKIQTVKNSKGQHNYNKSKVNYLNLNPPSKLKLGRSVGNILNLLYSIVMKISA